MKKVPKYVDGVSVIIPTVRTEGIILDSLKSVINSLRQFPLENKEMILSINRRFSQNDVLIPILNGNNFIRLIVKRHKKGSAYSRYLGIREAKYNTLLFTDDDCIVSKKWVRRLYKKVSQKGICTGMLQAFDKNNAISHFEEIIDYHRTTATDAQGRIKWLSFPNFGIKRRLLPKVPFNWFTIDTVEDMSLACRLRLKEKRIILDRDSIVTAKYPESFHSAAQRKMKHAKGLAYLKKSLNNEMGNKIEIESTFVSLKRWFAISLHTNLPPTEKIMFLLLNMVYIFGLCYFGLIIKEKDVHHINYREL